MTGPVVLGPGEGTRYEARGSEMVFKALAATAGSAHTFGNTSADQARLLVIHAPGLDAYFADLEELWSAPDPPTREQEQQLMARHGMEPA